MLLINCVKCEFDAPFKKNSRAVTKWIPLRNLKTPRKKSVILKVLNRTSNGLIKTNRTHNEARVWAEVILRPVWRRSLVRNNVAQVSDWSSPQDTPSHRSKYFTNYVFETWFDVQRHLDFKWKAVLDPLGTCLIFLDIIWESTHISSNLN